MTSFSYILIFAIASLLLSVGVGYIFGRQRSKDERAATMKAMLVMLNKTEELTEDVDSRNAELKTVGRTVEELEVSGEMAELQNALLAQIASVIHSNKKLEDDLVCAHYTLEKQAQELDRTRRVARTDPLSGVANRRSFDETLAYWLSSSNRKHKRFTLVLCDVDHFKWVNDTHGHVAGDRVVTHIGAVLRDQVRGSDFVARIGGDEFAVLLAQDDPELATEIADRIRSAVSARNFDVGYDNERLAITFSMGVALSINDDSAEALLHRADQALYISKESGRNRLRVAAPQAEAEADQQGEPESEPAATGG